jgi:hypothetical protein
MTQTAPRQYADAAQIPADALKAFIETRLRRREPPARIAAAAQAYFGIAIEGDQVVPYWKGEIALPTQTEHRPDKESVQLPADQPQEPNFTRMADVETQTLFSITPESSIAPDPAPVSGDAGSGAAPATQTGRRQDADSWQDTDSLQIPADPVDEPRVTREGRAEMIEALGALARARLGVAPDPAENADGARTDDAATQTGRRQNQKTKSVLTDEMKAFIVRGLARYETPTRVAASVQAEFGIAIDRRQVYAYDPAGSRPPAQRWIDLHAATRAKCLAAAAEIGVAQKVVRLRMLDRFANRAEEANKTERAAGFLAQAAKECGGFYERYARPHRVAAPASA